MSLVVYSCIFQDPDAPTKSCRRSNGRAARDNQAASGNGNGLLRSPREPAIFDFGFREDGLHLGAVTELTLNVLDAARLLAVDEHDDDRDVEPELATRLDGGDGRHSAGNDVVDDGNALARADRSLDALLLAVLFLILAHAEPS